MVAKQMTHILIGGEKSLQEATLDQSGDSFALRVTRKHEIGALPSFIAHSAERRLALCVSEGGNTLSSFSVSESGSLTHLSDAACPGGPAYCSFDASGRWAFTASYGSGETRVYGVQDDGRLTDAKTTLATGKYSHCVKSTANNDLLVVPSKGTDTLALIRFDAQTGACELLNPVAAPKGSGPRHIVFSRKGTLAYVSGENDCSLIIYRVDGESFAQIAHLPSLPGGQQNGDTGSDVHLSEDERFVYVSNRGDDSVSRFRISEDGASFEAHVPTKGKVPRNFCLLDEKLIVANQESNSLAIFSRAASTGALALQGVVATDERAFWVGNQRSS